MDLSYVLGDFGTVQKRVFAICVLRLISFMSLLYTVRFYSVVPEHWCAAPTFANLSASEWKECCVPESSEGFSHCQHYEIDEQGVVMNSSLVACDSWDYGTTKSPESFVNEWNLVCDRRWHVSLLYTLLSTGALIAYGTSGYLADRYGRRLTSLIGAALTLSVSLGSMFSTSVHMFAVMQFFGGAAFAFIHNAPETILMELVGVKLRSRMPILFNVIWGIVLIIYAGVAMMVPSWRYFVMIASIPQLAFAISALTSLPESPRWLLSVKKYSRAEQEIERLAAINGITIIDKDSVMKDLKLKIEGQVKPEVSKQSMGFFNSKRLVAYAAVLFSIKAAKGFVGGGFNINLAHMGGHPKINYMVNGLTGIASALVYELAKQILKYRRSVLIFSYAITGVAYMVTILIPDHLPWVKLAIAMTGNVFQKMANATLLNLAMELFPTDLRGKGVAGYMLSSRLGHILGSFSDLFVYKYGQKSIMLLFGGIYFIICIGVLILPQTQDKHLPESVAEAKAITKAEKKVELLEETKT